MSRYYTVLDNGKEWVVVAGEARDVGVVFRPSDVPWMVVPEGFETVTIVGVEGFETLEDAEDLARHKNRERAIMSIGVENA